MFGAAANAPLTAKNIAEKQMATRRLSIVISPYFPLLKFNCLYGTHCIKTTILRSIASLRIRSIDEVEVA